MKMKRMLLPLLLTFALWLACPFSGNVGKGTQAVGTGSQAVGTGEQGDILLSDPMVGLTSLGNYRASLAISFRGTQDGQAVDLTNTYVQTEWPAQAAKFILMDAIDESGVRQVILIGVVGEAQYFQADSNAPCTVDWGATAGGAAEFQLAFLLPAVGAARLAGEETMNGIASQHYTFDAASLYFPEDTTASGEVWIAMDGGYVLKYVLDITGADSYFGSGVQGTQHIEYLLSEVGAHPGVVYPTGCEPVLDWPVMEDATDLIRQPGFLAYNTNATAEAIFAFYEEKMTALGWEKRTEADLEAESTAETFARADTGASAIIAVDTEGSSRRVTIMAPDQEPAAAVADTTPGAQSANPSVRVALALTILFGMVPAQPGPPSYHLEVVNQSPVWDGAKIAQSQDAMSADVQGKDIHYNHRITPPGGSTTTSEAYLINNQEYAAVNGQVQPPTADSMTWTLWSLDLVSILSSGSSGATATGTEELDGRTAEIYELNSSGLSIPGVGGNLLPITSLTGRVWIDQATGALLKAVLDYQADISDAAGNLQGSGAGHLEITVTQIGNVTVALPQ